MCDDAEALHAGGTSCDLPALLQALNFPSTVREGLAFHEIIVEEGAASTNEEGCAEERGGGRAELLDFGDGVGEGSGVDEDLLVEPVEM